MRALLLHRDRDFLAPHETLREQRYRQYGPKRSLEAHEAALIQDLELETVLRAMAGDDPFLHEVARRAFLSAFINDSDTILYRQAVLEDCLANPDVCRQLYDLAVETIDARRKHWWGLSSHFAGSILHSAADLMQMLADKLLKLRRIAEANASGFESEGFRKLFETLKSELSDEYLQSARTHLAQLRFPGGTLMSAALGAGNAVSDLVLREDRDKRAAWLRRIFRKDPPGYAFRLHPRDEAGATIVSRLRDRGINRVADTLARSADHVLSFFETVRVELAFYVGCLNLHEELDRLHCPTCLPEPKPHGSRVHRFSELYDVSLALTMGRRIVANTGSADGKDLVIVSGANQGGKSSFLRSIGLAQLMMQSGMFVGALTFASDLCAGVFTHYRREEDATMTGGKLDEEMRRMSGIADAITAQSLMLFNESFASTNEREGSEIARQVVRALVEKRVKVFFVTHQYDFARVFVGSAGALFLLAERLPDGTRTFRLLEGEPLETSYGEDLYREIFAT